MIIHHFEHGLPTCFSERKLDFSGATIMPSAIVPTGVSPDRACILPFFIARLRADPRLETEFANHRVYWTCRPDNVIFSFKSSSTVFVFHTLAPYDLWMRAKADAEEAHQNALQRFQGPRIATERDVAKWQADDELVQRYCRQMKCRPDQLTDRLNDLLEVIDRLKQKKQELEQELAAQQ
jgi:hypothetical protein